MEAIAWRKEIDSAKDRVKSIDMMRGLVMIIMALDHTREFWGTTSFSPEDLSQTSPALFLTRWITHLCAPTFVFLSGAGIYFYQQHKGSRERTSVFTLSRGLWLMIVEIVVMTFIVTHNFNFILLGVFWMIGCCMVLMAGLIWLPRKLLIMISVLFIAGHNLLPTLNPSTPFEYGIGIFHNTPFFIPKPPVLVTYTIIPWIGVMLAGYLVGAWFGYPPEKRNMLLRRSGFILFGLFLILRLINVYGDPSPYSIQDRGWIFTLLSFLNVTKYPPSLQFLSLTIGIGMLLISFLPNNRTRFSEVLMTYGRVPFFFFIMHFALISLASYLWTWVEFGTGFNLAFSTPDTRPSTYEPNFARVYIVWLLVILVTYFPCKWFGQYKKENRQWWLSYL